MKCPVYIACENYVTNEQINFLQRIAQLEKVYMFLVLFLFDNQFWIDIVNSNRSEPFQNCLAE